ncbi:unnamed protein product [Effrenium voratum]|uniref:RNase H type-1 domain-containing protein n=1 Tax=Effrenium voratum TaxID=2562239 RepID=A0AA36J0F2_9DINO|nr:unnamed protein product [Effrenium voratum]
MGVLHPLLLFTSQGQKAGLALKPLCACCGAFYLTAQNAPPADGGRRQGLLAGLGSFSGLLFLSHLRLGLVLAPLHVALLALLGLGLGGGSRRPLRPKPAAADAAAPSFGLAAGAKVMEEGLFSQVTGHLRIFVIGVYAPTSSSTVQERHQLRDQVSNVINMAQATSISLLLGDINAELGNNQNANTLGHTVVGRFARPKITTAGQEWRQWAEAEGFRDCASRYQLRHRTTWQHPRYRSEHELDHIFIREECLWHLQHCRVLQEGPNVAWPWGDYTDHNPVEVRLRHGRKWAKQPARATGPPCPDVGKLRGVSEESVEQRKQWVQLVEERLAQLQAREDADLTSRWEAICAACRDAAVQVCGVLQRHKGQPWFRGRDGEVQQLDQRIQQARAADRRIQGNPDALPVAEFHRARRAARQGLRATRRTKKVTLGEWETAWLDRKAAEADEAADQGRTGIVFRVIKELVQDHRTSGFGNRRAADPQGEAEEWKQHFARIQAGRGEVADSVWIDVESREGIDTWLDGVPTLEEIRRSIGDMQCGKAPGTDSFMAEYLKYGGPALEAEIVVLVRTAWRRAAEAPAGREAEPWPKRWREGVICPLWKRKGDRQDKNTWRGITLLSVGSKLIARICSARLQRWAQPWLNALQFGFRPGTGVDDVQQITRAVLEEAAGAVHDRTILLRFFDLEKAYPKVARHALWKLLEMKGCPPGFLGVLKALHDHTASHVRFDGGTSAEFVPDRGLREGCPSSPVLFNLYHHGIMEVFRARRARAAQARQMTPGVTWNYKVDGKIGKRRMDRLEEGRNTRQMLIGDFAYADDTGILGDADEVVTAEELFASTLADFAGKVNAGKTEGLRVTSEAPAEYDIPHCGEATAVRHVGAMLGHRGNHVDETAARVMKSMQQVGRISKAWTHGKGAHRNRYRVKFSVRIKVMKAVLKGMLGSFARTRAWQVSQITRVQKIVNLAIRRCLGIRLGMLRGYGLSNDILSNMAQWEQFESLVRRSTLMWIGHVARMEHMQPQKAIMFGWLDGASAKQHAPPRQAQWVNSCLKAAKISEMDWFRLAQDRSTWRKIVTTAFPVEKVNPEREGQLDSWRPGRPVPPFALPQGRPERPDNEDEGSEADVAERVRGRARGQGQVMYGVGGRRAAARATRQQRAHRDEQGNWACPVCAETFNKANQVEFHYQEHHAVTDPRLVTTEVFTCQHCQTTYRRRKQLTDHLCPARQKLERLDRIDPMIHVGGPSREEAVPDDSPWALFTDGSGGTRGVAGWGVGIYTCRAPTTQEDWVAALYGPVITLPCDPQWMGAEAHTNNTGELSAIGEACKWLLQWKARKPEAPRPSAVILYDSQYAYGVATRLFRAKENQLLATSVASLVDAVRASMSLEFEHVKGHSGAHGNEVADRLADRGERRGVLRGQLKKVEERLDNVEWRLGRVELAQEQTDQYRRLRVEHSPRLQEVWRAFEAKEFEPHELRAKVAVAVGADVRECMGREVDEEALQAKSRELSHGRQAVPVRDVRVATSVAFDLAPLLEWVYKDRTGAFGLILARGEPSRVFTTQVKDTFNWALFVLAKLEGQGIQVYGALLWLEQEAPGSPAPVQPWQVDWCWRCGKVFSGPSHARQLAGHEGDRFGHGAPPCLGEGSPLGSGPACRRPPGFVPPPGRWLPSGLWSCSQERVSKLEEKVSDLESTSRIRGTGLVALAAAAEDIAKSEAKEFWKLKSALPDLLWRDLEEPLRRGISDSSKVTAIFAELVQCLRAHDALVGVFPAGGAWGRERSIDIRFRPGMPGLRIHHLIKSEIAPVLKALDPPAAVAIWVPLSGGEMKRRERKRARADSTAPAATAKSRAGNPGKGQGKKSRR